MKIGSVDLSREVLLIAEVGNNHEGDIQLAERLIGLAAEAGAQAVKFQTIDPLRLVARQQTARIEQLSRYTLSRDDHERLARVTEREGVMFLSTPFFLEAVDWLSPLVPAFKIASGDNDFDPLLSAVAADGKPVILSTGMVDLDGISHARDVIEAAWGMSSASRPGLVLLHCVSAYPTPLEQANLAAIDLLKEFADSVGYSDHTLGIKAAELSIAAGARVVEKHFTLDKSFSDFRDHQLSADPSELKALAESIRVANSVFGTREKCVADSERGTAAAARRSIVARVNLSEGHQITQDDLDWLRPAGGLSPTRTAEVLGRLLNCNVVAGEVISLEMLD